MNSTSPAKDRLARITSVSRIIAGVCGVLLIVFPLFIGALTVLWSDFLAIQSTARQMGVQAENISALAKLASFGAFLVSSAPLLWGLCVLRRLFQGYANGVVFTQAAANQLKNVAYALLALIIARPLGGALFSLALSIDTLKAPDGQGHLAIMVGLTEVWLGLAGMIVLVIAWIMGEAAALAEDNQAII